MVWKGGVDVFEVSGVYVPSDEDIEDCLSCKSCEYGICSECLIGKQKGEENEE